MTGQNGNFEDTTDVEWYCHVDRGSLTISGIGNGKVILINNETCDTFVMSAKQWEALKDGFIKTNG